MILLPILAALVGLAAQQRNDAPRRYVADRCNVSVASPYKLVHERRTLSAGARVDYYTAVVGAATFRLLCVSDPSIPGPSDDLFATYRDGFLDDDPDRLIAERPISFENVEGREIQGEAPDGTQSLVRIYLARGRAFALLVSGPITTIGSSDATIFLESLQAAR